MGIQLLDLYMAMKCKKKPVPNTIKITNQLIVLEIYFLFMNLIPKNYAYEIFLKKRVTDNVQETDVTPSAIIYHALCVHLYTQ